MYPRPNKQFQAVESLSIVIASTDTLILKNR